jgi:hypothetical protein
MPCVLRIQFLLFHLIFYWDQIPCFAEVNLALRYLLRNAWYRQVRGCGRSLEQFM